MKKILLIALFAAGSLCPAAAQIRTAYFMEGTTFRSEFNPAFAPTRGYVNIPVLGGVNFNFDGTLSLSDLLKKRPDGSLALLLSQSVSPAEAFKGLGKRLNSLNSDVNINIIGFGAYTKNQKNFWSVGINLRTQAGVDLPFSFFEFAKNLSEGENRHDVRGLNAVANSYAEIGFNYSFPIFDKLYVGARAKFLVGLGHGEGRIDQLNFLLNEEQWEGSILASMDLYLNGMTVGEKFNDSKYGFSGPAGYGFGIDLGATYDVLENLQVSLAVNDIGFISWGKSSAMHFQTDEKGLNFHGQDIIINGKGTQLQGSEQLSFDSFEFNTIGYADKGKTTALRATINAGAEYEMWDHWVGFGLLYHARLGLYKSSHNLTASVNFHPRHWFTFSPSYTFNNNRGGAIGLGLNFSTSVINFFLATDMLLTQHSKEFIPHKQDRMTFTFGLGVPLGRYGHRISAYRDLERRKDR